MSMVVGGATEFTNHVGGGLLVFLDLIVDRMVDLSGSSGAKASIFHVSAPGVLATGLKGKRALVYGEAGAAAVLIVDGSAAEAGRCVAIPLYTARAGGSHLHSWPQAWTSGSLSI